MLPNSRITSWIIVLAALIPQAQAQSPARRLGPSFDCQSAAAKQQPLAQVICSDPALARNELAYVIAFQAALQAAATDGQKKSLRDAANNFTSRITNDCALPRSGQLRQAPALATLDCLSSAFLRERDALVSQLAGPAREEAVLSPIDAATVQAMLRDQGYLPLAVQVDAVIGPATRTAILAWQRANGAATTAFASKAMLAGRSAASPSPRQAEAVPGDLQLPSCRNVRQLGNYTRHWFINRTDPILGVPPAAWNDSVLASVKQWAERCLSREVPANQASSFRDYWQNFYNEVQAGMPLLKRKMDQHAAQRTELLAIQEEMAETVPLSRGGAVSCASLGTTNPNSELDATLFGQRVRDYSGADFRTLLEKLVQCDALVGARRSSRRVVISYAPYRHDLQNLEAFVNQKRSEEAEALENERLARELQDPAKRAQHEAKEKERRFEEQESQLRAALEGKTILQPSDNPSQLVIFCGGYFSVRRAVDALIRADVTPSADDSAMRALGFQMLAQSWLANRQGVLGRSAVERELVPIYYAGINAGITANVDDTKARYRRCTNAAQALARERENLK